MLQSPVSLKSQKAINCILILLYTFFVLWYTVLIRGLASEL